jgi:hypothetical protein
MKNVTKCPHSQVCHLQRTMKKQISQKLRVIEEKQGHIQESGIKFYQVQLISHRKQNLCLPVLSVF